MKKREEVYKLRKISKHKKLPLEQEEAIFNPIYLALLCFTEETIAN